VDAASIFLSLAPPVFDAQNACGFSNNSSAASTVTTVHHYEETINGRAYSIEVSAVTPDKWRAQIARVPGGSRALMPFYGRTPDEAAHGLSRWLALAHSRSAPQV
jgi:hypothetical protein